MFNKRRLLLTAVAISMIGMTVVFAQQGGPRGDRGSRGNGDPSQGGQTRTRTMDPNMIFNFMSQGQDFLDVNSWIQMSMRRDPNAKDNIDKFVQQQGITNGRVNREQFAAYMQQRMAGGATSGGAPTQSGDDPRLRSMFDAIDTNKDGNLQPSEIRAAAESTTDTRAEERYGPLRDEFDKWDKNHNGSIDFEEFKEYYAARRQARDQNGNNSRRGPNGGPGDEFQPPTEEKHVVYRRDEDLPKDLPPWFKQIKRPNPGQIALRDWKNSGRTFDDFRKYDRNSDGFITVEEVMVVEKHGRSSSNQRGSQGNPDAEDPREEQTFVIAGPGAVSDDTVLAALSGDGTPGGMRGSQGNGFNRGNSQRGGTPNMGNFGKNGSSGGDPRSNRGGQPSTGSDPRSNRGGQPSTGSDPRSNRGGQPSGNTDRSNRGNRPRPGGTEEE